MGRFYVLIVLSVLFSNNAFGVINAKPLVDSAIKKHFPMVEKINSHGQTVEWYHVLNVDKDAEQGAIKKAYWKIARYIHPDKTEGKTTEAFQILVNAYEEGSNPGLSSSNHSTTYYYDEEAHIFYDGNDHELSQASIYDLVGIGLLTPDRLAMMRKYGMGANIILGSVIGSQITCYLLKKNPTIQSEWNNFSRTNALQKKIDAISKHLHTQYPLATKGSRLVWHTAKIASGIGLSLIAIPIAFASWGIKKIVPDASYFEKILSTIISKEKCTYNNTDYYIFKSADCPIAYTSVKEYDTQLKYLTTIPTLSLMLGVQTTYLSGVLICSGIEGLRELFRKTKNSYLIE